MGTTLANSEDPDEMQLNVAFHKGLPHLLFKTKLEQLASDKGPRLMPSIEMGISILAKILIIIHRTKPIFRHEQ